MQLIMIPKYPVTTIPSVTTVPSWACAHPFETAERFFAVLSKLSLYTHTHDNALIFF